MNMIRTEIIARALVILGALNWLMIVTFNVNLAQTVLRKGAPVLYILIGLAALYVAHRYTFWLPFLDQTALPSDALTLKTPDRSSVSIQVDAPVGSRVVYWAAEELTCPVAASPRQAYQSYENSGVAITNALGKALLKVRKPVPYYVGFGPFRRQVKPHIHYRIASSFGMLGPVKTVNVPE